MKTVMDISSGIIVDHIVGGGEVIDGVLWVCFDCEIWKLCIVIEFCEECICDKITGFPNPNRNFSYRNLMSNLRLRGRIL